MGPVESFKRLTFYFQIITNVEPPSPPAFPEPVRTPQRTKTNLSVVSSRQAAGEPSPVPEGEVLSPCRIMLQTFGSRFLPHSCSPINTLFPVLSEKFLLLGTPDGLSFLDVLPGLHGGLTDGTAVLRPSHELSDARRGDIWQGTAVWQMKLLEEGDDGGDVDDDNPRGVVLALVDGESESGECIRVIRMYKLDNLTRLVQWFATHKVTIDLLVQFYRRLTFL